jgi:hypothetical protein
MLEWHKRHAVPDCEEAAHGEYICTVQITHGYTYLHIDRIRDGAGVLEVIQYNADPGRLKHLAEQWIAAGD